ncbi:MAG: hypothetical protein HYX33_03400 [Actinobacteria bacterium]|nr:hypothetical protein [Actinomycetota bacterium]
MSGDVTSSRTGIVERPPPEPTSPSHGKYEAAVSSTHLDLVGEPIDATQAGPRPDGFRARAHERVSRADARRGAGRIGADTLNEEPASHPKAHGYVPIEFGSIDGCALIEAPRRAGAVYGEEYRERDTHGVVEALRPGQAIPPTPRYGAPG